MFVIKLSKIDVLFQKISSSYELYAPIEQGKQVMFGRWSETAILRLDELLTGKSAKECFFPQTETLYHAKREGKKIQIVEPEIRTAQTVYFGVRGCDAKSFTILDRVFLSEPVDVYYKEKREKSIIVAMACHEPERTCFCSVFGVDAAEPTGDVATWIIGDLLYWKAVTEKGIALTERVKDCFDELDDEAAEAAEKDVAQEKAAIQKKLEQLPLRKLDLTGFDGEHLNTLFNSPKWESLSKACLGCGTCTFVCPTCQCYDIRDYDTGHGIEKFRCWDSCMYSDFTMMAHGNNRTTQMQRFRQRFMHKLVYFPSNNEGEYSCVGCGRCLKKCPQSLNIARVILTLGTEK
ncbi:MAG: 4Fe-4S dicluster domain-containing protein [Lachnospiraceae bacterium]